MWTSRIFWRTFASFAALWLVGLILLGAYIEGRVRGYFLEEATNGLRTKAMLVRELVLATPDISILQDRIEKTRDEIGTRITLIDESGNVLADSDRDPRRFTLSNHLDRPEIQQARYKPFGFSSERHSETVNQDMMYLALSIQDPHNKIAFVRMALSQDQVQQPIRQVRRMVWSAAAVIGIVGMLLSLHLALTFIRPLRKLTQGAETISTGMFGYKVFLAEAGEFGQLAKSFNQMSENLAIQFAQLTEDRQKLQAVLGGMVEGVIALDAQQNLLFANERAGHLLEFSVRQAVGKKLWEVVRLRGLQELVQSGLRDFPCNDEVTAWAGSDSRTLTVNISPLPGAATHPEGANRGVVVVLHDTTKLRRLERLRQDFVANVSHELKTPLSVIKANVETLLEGAADDPTHRTAFLTRIAEQADRLHALILDLLSLARIESGTEVFEYQRLVCNEIACEVVEHFKARAESHKQTLLLETPNGGDIVAWADREAVQQILDNLVDNALKYTPDSGTITVRLFTDNEYSCLEVEDTGIGIPEPDLPRIFERFYRVDKARSREMGGTGLGLSIVKHLVQAMQGNVRAVSRVGHGTKFTVRLPRTPLT